MALRNSFGATHGQAMSPLPSTMTPQSPSGDRQPSTPRSPFQELVNVAVIDNTNTTKQNPLSDNASVASSSRTDTSAAFKRFTCAFDPQQRNGSALMLRFDLEGNATFEEMSRIDILRMTQEAATPMLNSEERGRVNAAARLVRATSFAGGMNLGASGAAAPPYGTIIDVQRVHARDIRKLDNAFSVSNEPSIELRNQAILMNADPVRAIIMRHCCLVFVPDGADSLLLMLQEMFRDAASQGPEVPYEFKALEALLGTLCRYFKTEYDKNAPVISTALDRLASGRMSASELELLRKFKNTMNEFESQVDGVRRALMEILDNEEDLRLLCLTKLHEDPSLLQDLWSFDSEEAEVLLENYLQDIFSTRTKASLMQHRIQNTESLVMLKLDSMRNYLLGVDLLFSILVVAISIGTFIAGIFGMNLNSGVQERAGWFWTVTGGSIGLIVLLTGAGWWFFRRQGVFMYKN